MTINARELEKIASHLRAALNILESQLAPPDVPEHIQEMVDFKLANRICLCWDHKIPEGDKVTRGQCSADYPNTMARIRRGDEDEKELIRTGKLTADRQKPGRKSKREQMSAAELKQVAETLETYKKQVKQPAQKRQGDKADE